MHLTETIETNLINRFCYVLRRSAVDSEKRTKAVCAHCWDFGSVYCKHIFECVEIGIQTYLTHNQSLTLRTPERCSPNKWCGDKHSQIFAYFDHIVVFVRKCDTKGTSYGRTIHNFSPIRLNFEDLHQEEISRWRGLNAEKCHTHSHCRINTQNNDIFRHTKSSC